MYLKELTLHGFKTFAKKTTLQLLAPTGDHHGITAIVGPNGSGKSNVADAIRWVLGEQSMKSLRGKAATDVIFSGSDGKTRAGFAEVEITFGDADSIEGIEMSELTIARRLYRDGESSYLINGAAARLSDIHMLLANANVGQKSYAIISQGHIDHILSASPEERKGFFDDATGVKPLQLKRHKASLKLKRTRENLSQAELLIEEIAPRLRTLGRLVKRLSEREEVETTLKEKEVAYYGTLHRELDQKLAKEQEGFEGIAAQVKDQQAILAKERETFKRMEESSKAKEKEQKEETSSALSELQEQYEALQESRTKIREERFEREKKIEREKAASVVRWTPLPLLKIIEGIKELKEQLKAAADKHAEGKLTEEDIDTPYKASQDLLTRLEKPAPSTYEPSKEDTDALKELESRDAKVVAELTVLKQSMTDLAKDSKTEQKELFALQHRMLAAQETLHDLETKQNNRRVALARLETRQEELDKDIKEVFGDNTEAVTSFTGEANTEDLYPEIQNLRHKLELIGGIDEETVNEYHEAKERHDFLDEQIADLMQALTDTEQIIDELDEQIKATSSKTFKQIRENFQHYFKVLFKGGSCDLKEIRVKDLEDPKQMTLEGEEEESQPKKSKKELERVVGVEIQATPPGKKLKSINLLSGGERAMTSIALISAIMHTNPSPFVVLDEVDAALDEANTTRFAEIVKELAPQTQFVIITHNRATMHIADALYGVTMKSDGISQLLSVKFEDIAKAGTARR